MNAFTKSLLLLFACCVTSFQGIAQDDCDCSGDDPTLEYCVLDLETGDVFSTESTACELFCDGYVLFWEGGCDDEDPGDGGGDDLPDPCDCSDDEAVLEWCVFDPLTGEQISVEATECEMYCEGFFIFFEGPCDGGWEDWPAECDCDYSEYAPVCVTLDDGTLCTFYNACEAECNGYTDFEEGECDYTWEPEECDCPTDEAPSEFCVIDLWTGEQLTVTGTECELFCEGFLVMGEGACDDIDPEEGDPCDCPTDEAPSEFCVLDLWTGEQVTVTGTECELFCEGFLVLGEGACDDVDPEEGDPCDCPEDEEAIEWCVIDLFTGEQSSVTATECEMFCEGLFLFYEGPCDDGGDPWPSDCDCDYDEYAPVCVTLEDGTLCSFYNACEAECFGYTDYEEGECDITWEPGDCDCEDGEEAQDYCVLDLWTGEQFTITGTECELFCEGFLILEEGACDAIDPEEGDPCECPEDDEVLEWCVFDLFTGEQFSMEATECEMYCEGYFAFFEGPCDDDGGWEDWPNECDCDYDDYAPVCVTLDDGTLCSFFNACEAECMGYTDYQEGECEITWEPGDCDCEDGEEAQDYCVLDLWTGEQFTVTGTECELFCEGFLILEDGACDEVEDPTDGPEACDCDEDEETTDFCVINLETGELETVNTTECELICEGVFLFWEGGCDIDGEDEDEEDGDGVDDGGNTLVALEDYSETYEIDEVSLYPNPAQETINVSVKSNMEGNVTVALYSITGQLLHTEQWTTAEGVQVKQINLGSVAPGMYTLTLTTAVGSSTAVQVVKR